VREDIPKWIPWLVSAAVISGIGLSIYVVVQNIFSQPATFVLILFLVLFALSTLTAMLFVTTGRFTVTAPGYTLMVSGPAVIWLGGTLLMIWEPSISGRLFSPLASPDSVEALEKGIVDVEKSSHWIDYQTWKSANRDFDEQIKDNERALLSELLENAFTVLNPHLLKSPRVTTAFLYFKHYVVKFQMVSGQQEDDAPEADIFFANRATDGDSSKLKKALLIADANKANGRPMRITNGYTEATVARDHFGWEPVSGKSDIRYLSIVRYYDGNSRQQDRIIIDMKKHTKGAGTIDLAALNYENPIAAKSVMWRMKGSAATALGQMPLLFRPYDAGNLALLFRHSSGSDSMDDARYAAAVRPDLFDWLSLIDNYLGVNTQDLEPQQASDTRAVQRFLTDLKSDIGLSMKDLGYEIPDPLTFSDLLQDSMKPRGVASFHIQDARDVFVALIKPTTN
jgi:hypothetical protein